MDRAANSAAWEQRGVRGVHDGVNIQCGDVGANGAKHWGHDLMARGMIPPAVLIAVVAVEA
jgi:hypothetical protein